MEGTHLPLTKWLQALHLLCSCKKGVSSRQLHRTLGITYKTAWFLSHHLREAMRDGCSLGPLGPLGPPRATPSRPTRDVTFIGRKEGVPAPEGGYSHKNAALALVERGGKVRTSHINTVTREEIGRIVRDGCDRSGIVAVALDRLKPSIGLDRDVSGQPAIQ